MTKNIPRSLIIIFLLEIKEREIKEHLNYTNLTRILLKN